MATRNVADTRFLVRDMGTCVGMLTSSDIISIASYSLGATYSVCWWGKHFSTGNGTAGRIMDDGTGNIMFTTGQNGIQVQHQSSGVQSANDFLQLGKWHHYAVTYDGSNIRYYRDATLFDTDAQATAPDTTARTQYIGNRADGEVLRCSS